MGVSFKQQEAQEQRIYCLSARGCQVFHVSEKSAEPSKVVELGLALSSSSSPSFPSSYLPWFSWSTTTALPQGLSRDHHLCFYCLTWLQVCSYFQVFSKHPASLLRFICYTHIAGYIGLLFTTLVSFISPVVHYALDTFRFSCTCKNVFQKCLLFWKLTEKLRYYTWLW